jgi:phosphatidate phosphatase APP1
MTAPPVVFLVDVDNTLLDNDRIQDDYIHKEEALDDVERRYPAEHYVLVDDKPRILAAVKKTWGDRVTTIFPRQGQYALDANAYRPADVTVERIADLLTRDFAELLSPEVTR